MAPFKSPLVSFGAATVEVGGAVSRIDFDEFRVIGDGSIQVRLAQLGIGAIGLEPLGSATAEVGVGGLWVEFNGSIAVNDSPVLIALPFFSIGTVDIGFGVFRIEFNSFRVVSDSPVHIPPFLCFSNTSVVVGFEAFRVEFDGF